MGCQKSQSSCTAAPRSNRRPSMHRRTCARHLACAHAASLSAVTSLLPHSPGKCLLLQDSLQNPLPWGALLITLPDLGWIASRDREPTHVQGRDSLLEGLLGQRTCSNSRLSGKRRTPRAFKSQAPLSKKDVAFPLVVLQRGAGEGAVERQGEEEKSEC